MRKTETEIPPYPYIKKAKSTEKIPKYMSYKAFRKQLEVISKVRTSKTLEVELAEEELGSIEFPDFLQEIMDAYNLSKTEVINVAINELNIRLTSDILTVHRDIMNIISNYPDLDKDSKNKLLGYILKNLEKRK